MGGRGGGGEGAFENEGKYQGQLNVQIDSFGGKICKSVKLATIVFFCRSAAIENFKYF